MVIEITVFVTPAMIRLDNFYIRKIVTNPEIFEVGDRQILLVPQASELYTVGQAQDARRELEEILYSFGLSIEEVDYFYPYIDMKYRRLIHLLSQAGIPGSKIVYGICDCISKDDIQALLEESGVKIAHWYHLRCSASCSSFDRKVNEFFLNRCLLIPENRFHQLRSI